VEVLGALLGDLLTIPELVHRVVAGLANVVLLPVIAHLMVIVPAVTPEEVGVEIRTVRVFPDVLVTPAQGAVVVEAV